MSVKQTLHVNIDQQVFLLDQGTREVFEIYHIEDHHIETKLGKFSKRRCKRNVTSDGFNCHRGASKPSVADAVYQYPRI